MKIDLTKLLADAQKSGWGLKKLNFVMSRGIPFNKPHGIVVHKVENDTITTKIPYKKKNLNHIKGVHACGLATVGEFCSGLNLLRKIEAKKYRLIMQHLEVEYFYQARKTAYARHTLSDSTVKDEILGTLDSDGVCYHTCKIEIHDEDQNHLCNVFTKWQIKEWSKVKTKI